MLLKYNARKLEFSGGRSAPVLSSLDVRVPSKWPLTGFATQIPQSGRTCSGRDNRPLIRPVVPARLAMSLAHQW